MKRLDFVLPDFVRLSWVSDLARDVWEQRLKRITKAWFDIEWLTILADIRSCGVTIASPEDFVYRAGEWAKHGLNALPVEIQGLSVSYASTSVRAKPGKPFVFRIVIGTPQSVTDFKHAWDANDHQAIGKLLGYPSCCHDFFSDTWIEQGLVDTTWPMAIATDSSSDESQSIEVSGPPEANILWRWMGIRAVPHLPCRFDCRHTMELGNKFVAVGREAGYNNEMDWMLEILSWPVEWSALHGIAEIKTPVLKVSARTDATPCKYTVRYHGNTYPLEGAQGLNFPYRTSNRPQSQDFQGLNQPKALNQYPEWYASDNGFNTTFEMDKAHKPIVKLTEEIVSSDGGNVLDLGCGNGALLKKIYEVSPDTVPFGIEIEPERVEHAHVLNPEFADNFTLGNLFENELIWSEDRQYTLAILMPGRLLQATPEQAAKLKKRIKDHCDYLLVYAYGDWLTRYDNLSGLVCKVGISLQNLDTNATASLAEIR